MKTVTIDQFVNDFAGRGAKFATFWSCTRPKLLKKHRLTGEPCPYSQGVERRAVRSVQLGAIYENSVNNQRNREAEDGEVVEHFTAQGLWKSSAYPDGAGERDSLYTVKHKGTGERYFAVKPAADADGHVRVNESYWFNVATDEPLTPDQIDDLEHYLPTQSDDSGRQGTDVKVNWRTFKIENVIAIQCGEFFLLSK